MGGIHTGARLAPKRARGLKDAILFLVPSFVGFLVFTILPMVTLLFVSMTDWDGLSELALFSHPVGFMRDFFVGLANYRDIFFSSEFYQVLGNTLKYVVLYMPSMLVLSMGVALVLSSKIRGTGVFRVLYYIPVLTSWVAGSLIWKWVLSPEYGVINNLLGVFGIRGPSWLQSPQWAMVGIVIASVWKDMGYFGLMLLSGLQGINRQYYEAAQIDGAGRLRQFFRITLPLIADNIKTQFTFWTIGCIGFFLWSRVFSVVPSDPTTITPASYMYDQIFGTTIGANTVSSAMNVGMGAAIGVVLCLITVAAMAVINLIFPKEKYEM